MHDQRIKDGEQLKTLAVLYYVMGGLTVATTSIALIHFITGLFFIFAPPEPGMKMIGFIFAGIAALVLSIGWSIGGGTIYAGRMIQVRRRPLFTKIMAAFNCWSFPFGTALGVWTFVLLSRPSVKALYDRIPLPLMPPEPVIDEHEELAWKELEKQSEP